VTVSPSCVLWSDGPALTEATANRCGKHVTGPCTEVKLDNVQHWILETNPGAVVPHLMANLGR
jgi:hypothetical protein